MNTIISSFGGQHARAIESSSVVDERSSHSDSTEGVVEIVGDQFHEKEEEISILNLTSRDMWALGLTTAIGGHYFAWNAGLSVGFGYFVVVLLLISTAYLSLVLCMAELSSAIPFAGNLLCTIC